MKRQLTTRLSFVLLLSVLLIAPVFAQRVKYNFNQGWKVFVGDAKGADDPSFNDAAWKSVTLPYAWNEDDAFKKDIRDLSTGISWYRKHFKLPSPSKGRQQRPKIYTNI